MTATVIDEEVETLVAPLRAVVDQLLDAELDHLMASQVTALFVASTRVRRGDRHRRRLDG